MRNICHLERAYGRNLGGWIRDTRKTLGLSLERFGLEIGVNRNTIWRWEHGLTIPNVYQYSLIRRLVRKMEAAQ